MRRFVIVGHTVPTDGAWGLDDLAGAAGRVDVLCRAVAMALFTSHAVRADTEVFLVFPQGPVTVRIRGADVQRLNPDERSTAARIRNALRHGHPDPWWESVEDGIEVAPFGLERVLHDVDDVLWLERDGQDIMDGTPPEGTWVLSDHRPFSDDERGLLAQCARPVSLGGTWYHGHHAIAVVQYLLDRA